MAIKIPWWVKVRSGAIAPIRKSVIWARKSLGHVQLSDTTLRDGEQTPGVRFSPSQKVQIAKALADLGIDSLDAGFPAAAPEEVEAIQKIVRDVKGPKITALCRCIPGDIDLAYDALKEAPLGRRGISLFIGTSPLHRERKHQLSRAQIVVKAVEAIQYARRFFEVIIFSPEDASRTEPEFLHEIYREAIAAGVVTVGFTDTVGILTPRKAADYIRSIQDNVPNINKVLMGVHFHNDLGMATANSLACIEEGVNVVQGTINGLGERAGNTALEEVAIALALHRDQYQARCPINTPKLREVCRLVAELSGMSVPATKPVAGANLFITAAGIHQDGLLKEPQTYLPYPPEKCGGEPVQLVLSKHSGKHGVLHRLESIGLHPTDDELDKIIHHLKHNARKPVYQSDKEIEQLWAEVFSDSLAVAS